MQNTRIPIERKRRSEALTKEEQRLFVKLYNSFATKADAEYTIGLKRQILDMVALKGSASPESIQVIREALSDPKRA